VSESAPEPSIHADVPAPFGLTTYFHNLSDWVDRKPCRDPFVQELIEARGMADRERSEFDQGRSALWKLIPPITVDEVEDVELGPPGLIALGLALVLQARHAMLAFADQSIDGRPPEPIPSAERLIRYTSDQLQAAGRTSKRGTYARLSALRADLQELRAVLSDREDQELGTVDESRDSSKGMATARRGERSRGLGERIMDMLPGPVRAITNPGALVDAITEPGLRVLGLDMHSGEYRFDKAVPPPLGLYPYLAELDHWAAEEPLDEPFVNGLLAMRHLDDTDRAEYRPGRSGLWGLVPPIDAGQVADASLTDQAARALALAVVVWARHVLTYYAVEQQSGVPPLVAEAGELVAGLNLFIDVRGDEPTGAERRLLELGADLEDRGVRALSALEGRKASIVEAHRSEVEARREAEAKLQATAEADHIRRGRSTQVSKSRVALALLLPVAMALLWVWYPSVRSSDDKPADAYKELPLKSIIRHSDKIQVRVDPVWMASAVDVRQEAAVALWERFGAELDGEHVDLELRTPLNQPLGRVHVGEVTWVIVETEQEPDGEDAPEGEEPDEGPP